MKTKPKQRKKSKQLYLIRTASGRMGGRDDMEFTDDIAGICDTPWITIYEVRELTKKEFLKKTKPNSFGRKNND